MSKPVDGPEIVRLALIVRKLERAFPLPPSGPADGRWYNYDGWYMAKYRELVDARTKLNAALDSRL